MRVLRDAGEAAAKKCAVDPPTFRELFTAEFAYVWNSLRRLGIPDRDLEDLAHDVFIHVYKRQSDFDPGRPLRPWLFGFAFRIASEYRRRSRNRRELLEPAAETSDPASSALDQLVRAESLRWAHVALESLDLDRRAVFILHEIDGIPMPEIAIALGIPVNTAYSRLRSARAKFQRSLQRERLRRGQR
jgi:RNA polymerase sigma-70 factor (ECF subfamily)